MLTASKTLMRLACCYASSNLARSTWHIILASCLLVASPLAEATGPIYIFGGQGHKEFLGCLNCGEMHPKSVWNEMSTFGFKNDFGVWGSYGQYASAYSSYSMCNQYSTDAPIIVDEQGNAYGRLSLNEYAVGSVCSVTGSERLCRVVRSVCASK